MNYTANQKLRKLTFKLDHLMRADHYDMENFEIAVKVFVEKKSVLYRALN